MWTAQERPELGALVLVILGAEWPQNCVYSQVAGAVNEGPNQCVLLQGGREDVTFREKEVGPLPHAGKCLMADWGTCLSLASWGEWRAWECLGQ